MMIAQLAIRSRDCYARALARTVSLNTYEAGRNVAGEPM